MDTSGIHFQTEKILQNTIWEWARVPGCQKRIHRPRQNLVGWRKEVGKRWQWAGGPAPGRGLLCVRGTEAGIRSPHWGIVWNREAFEAESEVADLWQSEWNESHTNNRCHSPTYTGWRCKSLRKHSGLELEHRYWRAIPGWGLLLTVEWIGERSLVGYSPWVCRESGMT